MSKFAGMAERILESIGGSGNVEQFTNCMTRLRVSVVDHGRIDEAGLKQIDGVLGVVDDETYQIILGPGVVNKVAEEFGKLLQAGGGGEAGSPSGGKAAPLREGADIKAELKQKNNTPFKNFFAENRQYFYSIDSGPGRRGDYQRDRRLDEQPDYLRQRRGLARYPAADYRRYRLGVLRVSDDLCRG
ncbi:hypothetical protein HMSSN036_10250 [Paenibacillus macerans]|nr:hypothetical protein HMSSN036_10250 [Paenibacillus macerans]